jgi:glycosyltransferase involved in cell wall biosynthesis
LTVVPSIWEEPFGRVALESLFHGVPVVASNRGALPEIVTKEFGIIVEPTEEDIARGIKIGLKKRRELAENIEKNKKVLFEKFVSVPVMKYMSLYKELI